MMNLSRETTTADVPSLSPKAEGRPCPGSAESASAIADAPAPTGNEVQATNATDKIWRMYLEATEDLSRAHEALAAVEATLPADLRQERMLEKMAAGVPAAELRRQRGDEANRAEDAVGNAQDRQCALERELIACDAATAVDVDRKLATLRDHIAADDDDWSMKIIRRAREDLQQLAAREQVAPVAEPSDDPALAAFERWCRAYETELAYWKKQSEVEHDVDQEPGFIIAEQAATAAARELAAAVATTPAGIVAQIRFAHYAFGEHKLGHLGIDPKDYEIGGNVFAADLLRSLLAGAERLAGEVPR